MKPMFVFGFDASSRIPILSIYLGCFEIGIYRQSEVVEWAKRESVKA
jgi:hypothetical protein